jgi:hypothetical protein
MGGRLLPPLNLGHGSPQDEVLVSGEDGHYSSSLSEMPFIQIQIFDRVLEIYHRARPRLSHEASHWTFQSIRFIIATLATLARRLGVMFSFPGAETCISFFRPPGPFDGVSTTSLD